MAKSGYSHYHIDQQIIPYVERSQELIVVAFQTGYTLVEIARAINQQYETVYRCLRERAILPQRRAGRTASLPPRLKAHFDGIKLRFPKWCLSHQIEVTPSALALSKFGEVPKDGDLAGLAAHEAFARDFPHYYQELYLGKEQKGRIADRWGRKRGDRYGLTFEWIEEDDDEKSHYLVTSPDIPSLKLMASDLPKGMDLFLKFSVAINRIDILEKMIEEKTGISP